MKPFLSIFVIAVILTLPKMNLATPMIRPLLISQTEIQHNSKPKIQLAFPNFVVVSLRSGNLTTGNFIDFNKRSLIIAFKGYTTGIPLTDIKSIEFKESVLIPANETIICKQINNNCRQISLEKSNDKEPKILANISLNNLSLFRGAKTTLLTIPENLESNQTEDNLNLSSKNIHIVNAIEMEESGEMMTIKVTSIPR